MSGIQQWAFSICAAMVACGLAQMLLPKSGLEKILKVTISVFFLCCILSPMVFRSPDLRIQIEQQSQEDIQRRAARLTEVVEQQSDAAIRQNLTKIVADKLLEKGINYHSITIHINTNGQNSEAEPLAEIELDREYEASHDSLRGELMSELGMEVRLGYSD